jgi:tetratricopeptide (TPR) repeat protein
MTLLTLASGDGARQYQLHCTPRSNSTPFYPVSALLCRLANIGPNDTMETRKWRLKDLIDDTFGAGHFDRVSSYLAPLVGIKAADDGSESPERVRETTIRTLVELAQVAARQMPLLLLIEDIHWSDPTTMLFVETLAATVASLPILILTTTRLSPEAPTLPSSNASVIALEPLDDLESAIVVRDTTAGSTLPGEVVSRIVRRAEGNPLFLEELTLAAVKQPAVAAEARDYTDSGQTANVPLLQPLIEARLDRLPTLRPIIQAASVLGREFPLRLLRELLVERGDDVAQAAARLVDLGLLVLPGEKSGERLRFKHALIHESVHQTMLPSESRALHSRAAELLVRHFDGLPESAPDVLADHLAMAQRFEEALRCLAEAGAETASRAAYRESVLHNRKGLAWVDRLTDERARVAMKLRLLTQLGEALSATKGYSDPEVQETYNDARALCDEQADHVASFPIVRGLTTFFFVRNEQHTADELSIRCLNLAKRAGRPDFVIEALTARGYTNMYLGKLSEAQENLEECTALYAVHHAEGTKYASPQDPANAAWSVLGTIAWLRGYPVEAESHCASALEHVERLHRPFDRAYAGCFLAQQRNLQRRFDEAFRLADDAVVQSHRHGFGIWLVCGMMQRAIATASMSASSTALAELEQILGGYMAAGARAGTPFFMWGLASGLAKIGDVEKARRVVADGLVAAETSGETYLVSELLVLQANLEPDDRAAATLQTAASKAAEQGAVTLELRALLALMHRMSSASTDPASQTAWDALNGVGDYPKEPDWIVSALPRVRSLV